MILFLLNLLKALVSILYMVVLGLDQCNNKQSVTSVFSEVSYLLVSIVCFFKYVTLHVRVVYMYFDDCQAGEIHFCQGFHSLTFCQILRCHVPQKFGEILMTDYYYLLPFLNLTPDRGSENTCPSKKGKSPF